MTSAPSTEPRVPVWVPFAVLAAVFLVIALFGIVAVGVLAAADPTIKPTDPPDWVTIALTVVQDLAFVAAAWIAVHVARGGARARDFGLRRVPLGRSLRWMATVYAAFWVIAGLLVFVFGQPPDQEIVTELKHESAFLVLAGFAALTCMLAPFAEEFFFRGFMFTVLSRRLGAVWAALIVGGVFGLVHAPGSPALGVAVLAVFGVALCALYVRTRSIIPCMALHAIHNSISFASTKSLPLWELAGLAALSAGVVVGVAGAVARTARPAVTG